MKLTTITVAEIRKLEQELENLRQKLELERIDHRITKRKLEVAETKIAEYRFA